MKKEEIVNIVSKYCFLLFQMNYDHDYPDHFWRSDPRTNTKHDYLSYFLSFEYKVIREIA